MVSDEPLHVTCVGAWEGSWLVLLGLLLVGQIARLLSCHTSARRPWFQNEKTPAGGMPTEVAEEIMWIKKASPLLGFVHKRRVLVPVTPRGRPQQLHRPPLKRSVISFNEIGRSCCRWGSLWGGISPEDLHRSHLTFVCACALIATLMRCA